MTGRVMDQAAGDGWALFNGDSAEVLPGLPDHSVDFSVFSPPFSASALATDLHQVGATQRL